MTIDIHFFSTSGCFACRVMSKIIHCEEVANRPEITAIIEENIDLDKDSMNRAKELGIKDFPTTIFVNNYDNNVVGKLVGTYPIDTVVELINNLVALP